MATGTGDVQAEQRSEALARANWIRAARAAVKRRIADGSMSAAEAVLQHPQEIESMPVGEVLTSQRHWGNVRCRRLLLTVGLHERKSIGSMTERQRRELAARL